MHETHLTRKHRRIIMFFSSNRMRAKNGAGKIYGDVDSLGRPSEKVSIRTEPVAPPPPREVCNFAGSLPHFKDRDLNVDDIEDSLSFFAKVIAKGVLSSAITINWKPPTTNNGSVIARFILEYEIEGDGPYRRAFDPLTEGCQISNLTPGQKVVNCLAISYKLICNFNFVPCRYHLNHSLLSNLLASCFVINAPRCTIFAFAAKATPASRDLHRQMRLLHGHLHALRQNIPKKHIALLSLQSGLEALLPRISKKKVFGRGHFARSLQHHSI
jgi:hypothetical protein